MRALFIVILLFPATVFAAVPVINMQEVTSPTGDDVLYIVDDPAGTPHDRKITVSNLLGGGIGAATVTVGDNETTNEENEIPFVANADGPGDVSFESDSGFTYNPATGTVTATIFSGALSGNATTASALAANGANCSAGSAPLGVDANGAAESCTDFEEDLSNSAGLAAALSDETGSASGTPLTVFNQNPTFDGATISDSKLLILDDATGADVNFKNYGNGLMAIYATNGSNNNSLFIDTEVADGGVVIQGGSSAYIDIRTDLLAPTHVRLKTADTYTVGTDYGREGYGTLFINNDNDAIDYTLDGADAGKQLCFMQGQGVTGAITVQPAAGDYLVKDSVRNTIATDYTSTGTGADKLCIVAVDDTDWLITEEVGTWSE